MLKKNPVKYILMAALPAALMAAPDPEIFDGRVVQQKQQSTSVSATTGPSASGVAARSGAERQPGPASGQTTERSERDFSEIGQAGGGQAVSTPDAQAPPHPVSPASGAETSGDRSSSTRVAGSSSPEQGDAGSVSGSSASSASGEPRNFEEIGSIGGGGASQTVDVKSSKAAASSASSSLPPSQNASNSSPGLSGAEGSSQSRQGQGAGGSGSQPATGSGRGDFGNTLPPGI
ncbi:MAG: hypothetical protein ACPG3X_04375 [Opitutales bacterium]